MKLPAASGGEYNPEDPSTKLGISSTKKSEKILYEFQKLLEDTYTSLTFIRELTRYVFLLDIQTHLYRFLSFSFFLKILPLGI